MLFQGEEAVKFLKSITSAQLQFYFKLKLNLFFFLKIS